MRRGTRWCIGCRADLTGDLDELFYQNGSRKDRLSSRCRLCTRIYNREYYKRNKERIMANVKAWRARNPKKVRAIYDRQNALARFRNRYPDVGRYDLDEDY